MSDELAGRSVLRIGTALAGLFVRPSRVAVDPLDARSAAHPRQRRARDPCGRGHRPARVRCGARAGAGARRRRGARVLAGGGGATTPWRSRRPRRPQARRIAAGARRGGDGLGAARHRRATRRRPRRGDAPAARRSGRWRGGLRAAAGRPPVPRSGTSCCESAVWRCCTGPTRRWSTSPPSGSAREGIAARVLDQAPGAVARSLAGAGWTPPGARALRRSVRRA